MASSRKPHENSPPSEHELLRAVYHHLDHAALMAEYPTLGPTELRKFFRRVSALLPNDEVIQRHPSGSPARTTGTIILHTDGCSHGNPGPAGCGAVLLDSSGAIIEELSKSIGTATSNEAEYHALIMGLDAVLERGARQVIIRADSQLLVRQLTGAYKVKSRRLMPLFLRVTRLLDKLSSWQAEHIPRKFNQHADRLATEAIRRRSSR